MASPRHFLTILRFFGKGETRLIFSGARLAAAERAPLQIRITPALKLSLSRVFLKMHRHFMLSILIQMKLRCLMERLPLMCRLFRMEHSLLQALLQRRQMPMISLHSSIWYLLWNSLSTNAERSHSVVAQTSQEMLQLPLTRMVGC